MTVLSGQGFRKRLKLMEPSLRLLRLSPSENVKLNFLTLSFPGELEKDFREHYFSTSLSQVRIASVLGVFFYGIFGILDSSLVPEVRHSLWFIRYAIVCPLVLLVFLSSFSRNFIKFMQPAIAVTVLVAGLGIIKMILIAPYPASHSYYAGLILVFFYGYTFYKLRFVWASLTGWIIVIMYEIAAIWLNPTEIPILINNNFFFLTGNVFGMFGCYSIEYYLRKDYLQARLLDLEKKKAVDVNVELEKRVKKRTAELVKTNEELKQEITERRQVEEALRESEEKYRNILESIEDGYFEVDTGGNFTFMNDSMAKFLGYSRERLVGMNYRGFMDEENAKKVFKTFNSVYRSSKTRKTFNGELIRKDGSRCWIETSVSLKTDSNGQPLGFRGIARDVTERIKAAELIQESKKKLSRAKKMESLGLLAGGVAHDLNNVLSGIVSYPELILMDLPEDSKLRRIVETMQESGERAAAIVQDLLTVARGVATTKQPLSLNDLISDYLNSPEFKKLEHYHPTVTFKTNFDTGLFTISGSDIHIRKVVMNLISNASEAIDGSGNVTISTTNRYIDKPLKRYDDISIGEYAVLSVSDDGSGISSNDLERMFEPFYTKKVLGRSGTGLGLTVVWNVMQDHGGYIDVKSNENGTTFELYFPITREEISDKALPIFRKEYKGTGETILVIDDVESQRDISCGMAEKLGYKPKAVSSGEEAVEYLKKNSVDLLLLDMIMDPGINGRETYERIIEIHPNQRAIIVSGLAESDDVKEAQKLGAGQYLKKPIKLEQMGLAIKEELEK